MVFVAGDVRGGEGRVLAWITQEAKMGELPAILTCAHLVYTELAPAAWSPPLTCGEGVATPSWICPGGNPEVSKIQARSPPFPGPRGPSPAARPPYGAVPSLGGMGGRLLKVCDWGGRGCRPGLLPPSLPWLRTAPRYWARWSWRCARCRRRPAPPPRRGG